MNQPNQQIQPNIPEPQPSIQPEIPKKSGLPTWASILIVILSVMIVGLVSYGAYHYFAPQPEPAELPTAGQEEPAGEPTDPTADWQTYRNEEYGYEIKYPPAGNVIDVGQKEIEIPNFCINIEIEKDGCYIAIDTSHIYPPDINCLFRYDGLTKNPEFEKREEEFSLSGAYPYTAKINEEIEGDIHLGTIAIYKIYTDASVRPITIVGSCRNYNKSNEAFLKRIIASFKGTTELSGRWKTFWNEKDGYEIKYPDNWTFIPPEAKGGPTLVSSRPEVSLNRCGTTDPNNQLEIFFGIDSNPEQLDIDTWCTREFSEFLSKKEKNIDGVQAVEIEWGTRDEISRNEGKCVCIPKENGDIVIIRAIPLKSGHMENFNQILSTFKFID